MAIEGEQLKTYGVALRVILDMSTKHDSYFEVFLMWRYGKENLRVIEETEVVIVKLLLSVSFLMEFTMDAL